MFLPTWWFDKMLIRPLEEADFPEVADLLRVLAREFIVHESTREGAATFLRENDEAGLRGYLALGHVYHVALIDGGIAGFIAMRERGHLFHLFVDKRWHRQGVARQLWEVARAVAIEAGNEGVFTVNSSNYAVPLYEALGFVRTAPMQCVKGLSFTPMRLHA
jgi:ribosomal protein S18 acetylase RimI-like enzyme